MREIKFRAWFEVHKKMVYNLGFDENSFKGIDESVDIPNVYDKDYLDENWLYDATLNFKIMQYTGLKDKNGKEIYEGDICRVIGGEQWQGYMEIDFIGEVVFVTASFCVKDKNDCHYDFGYIENVEVIGNIYENPELLK